MSQALRYNVNGDYAVFSRMKEKGISLAAFATTIVFLVLTVIMVSVTLQSAYAWLVMGSTLFLFLTLCSYSSCEKTQASRWRRSSISSDSVSTISEARDCTMADYNRSILPYWITDLPPSYTAAISTPCPPPPPYSSIVRTSDSLSLPPPYSHRTFGPPERVHSLRIKSNTVETSDCDSRSDRGQTNPAFVDSTTTC